MPRLRVGWTFLLFGYTHCTDVCRMTLPQIREVRRVLAAHHGDVPTAWVFVTVDPARDTREALALYAAHFGDGLIAVGGATKAIKGFADQFRVRYASGPPQPGAPQARSAGAYDIDHTASVALLGPDGKLHASSTPPRPTRPAPPRACMPRILRRVAAPRPLRPAIRIVVRGAVHDANQRRMGGGFDAAARGLQQ